jgi:hypothetical protein
MNNKQRLAQAFFEAEVSFDEVLEVVAEEWGRRYMQNNPFAALWEHQQQEEQQQWQQ